MTLILNEKYIGINNSYKLFISNRFLRIYPIYWVILFFSIMRCFAILIYSNGKYLENFGIYYNYFESMNFGSLFFIILTNLFIFLQDAVMFLGLDTTSGILFFTTNYAKTNPQLWHFLFIPQAWSIGIEISFYLIAPFLVKRKIKIIIFLIILSIILRLVIYFYFGLKIDPWTYRFFPTELLFFLLGVISYHIYKKLQTFEIKNIFNNLILAGIIGFTITYSFLPVPGPLKSLLYLITFFISLPLIFLYTKNWKTILILVNYHIQFIFLICSY